MSGGCRDGMDEFADRQRQRGVAMDAEDANPTTIRAAFGRLAIGVAVITTLDGGEPHGATGMAWAEHPAPPLVLTTLRRSGRTRQLVSACGAFGVNVLAARQAELVRQFAGSSREPTERMRDVPLVRGQRHGLPLLRDSVVALECAVTDVHPFGGHDIVVGRVETVRLAPDAEPLVYCAGTLGTLAPVRG